MIKECSLWLGKYPQLFSDELDSWVTDVSSDFNIQSHDAVKLSVGPDTDVASWIANELSDDDVWFSPRKLLILRNLEELKSAQASELFDYLEGSECLYYIALTQGSGAVLKRVDSVLSEKPIDYKLPDKPDKAATFGREWLKGKGVKVSYNALKQLADYAGEERHQFASVLVALSTVKHNGEMGWDDIRRHTGDVGAVKIFDITNAIARGDREGAVLSIQRLGTATHPLALLKMLEKRYRGYVALLQGGGEEVAEKIGVSTNKFALDNMIKESKKLGEVNAIKSLGIVLETQQGLKGESSLSADDAMTVMAIKLSSFFSRKN